MNLIGKIFVVLIFVMSLVFMSIAIALYASQKNWREAVLNEQAGPDKPLGLKKQLEIDQKCNTDLKTELKGLTDDRDKAKNDHEQALAKLQIELETMTQEIKNLELEYAALEKAKSESVTAMNSTQGKTTQYREDLKKLGDKISDVEKDRDAIFKDVVDKTVEWNQAVNDKELLRKRMDDLAKDLAKAKEALIPGK